MSGRNVQERLRHILPSPGDLTAQVGDTRLPVHFFTIVLNGEPFIRYHLDVFRRLPFRWHWHVVEGVASLVHDTAWSVAGGGRIDSEFHADGLSVDGTSAYLDEVAAAEPHRVSLYRTQSGTFWDGKREMVSAPLANVREECLLWQVDADELWTAEQIQAMHALFLAQPERMAAYYWCHYIVAPGAVITTRYNYAANPAVEWLRTWRFQPGDHWESHEPPVLVRPRRRGGAKTVAASRPFSHDESETVGAVFQHFAYATEEQVRFKEGYYGYDGAVAAWQRLRSELTAASGPLRLSDYLPWVDDDTLVDAAERRRVPLLAHERGDGTWEFGGAHARPSASADASRGGVDASRGGVIVIDGVFFQHFLNSGIARVWRSYLREWIESGFAKRVIFLDRGGAGPRLPGLPTRSIARWEAELSASDSLRLQRVCDEEGAGLFVSTYYTTPINTPSLMLVYDLIPERLGLDMTDPVWDEKRLAIRHADAYACISENTRRDLLELESECRERRVDVVPLGVAGVFRPASDEEIAAFKATYALDRPYFLIVGERRGVDGYKNAELGFRAFRVWEAAGTHQLVCVGGQAEIEPELRALVPRTQAVRLALSDEELRLAYAGAVALVFPSRYEGFGLPVAEAMASGCPVITTRLASLPEVAGDAALYVDPDDPASLCEAFDAVRQPERRAAMIEAGIRRATRFNWPDASLALARLLESAAAADTPERREARGEAWRARREALAGRQRIVAARRPRGPEHAVEPGVRVEAWLRLKALARRRLPPRAIRLLRFSRAAAHRLGRLGHSIAAR